MSLRSKIALMLFTAVILFITLDITLNRLALERRFDESDLVLMESRLELVADCLESWVADLDRIGQDLETHLAGPAGWESAVPTADLNLVAAIGRLHVMLAYDAQGRVYLHEVRDPETGEPLNLRSLPNERLSQAHPLVRGWDHDLDLPRGVMLTERGAILVSVGEPEGHSQTPIRLAVGRFLDQQMVAHLSAQSDLDVEMIEVHGGLLSEHEEAILSRVAEHAGPVVEQTDRGSLRAWVALDDFGESPALLLRLDAPRQFDGLWAQLSRHEFLSAAAVAVLFPLMILLLLQRIVTGPLSRLTSHVVGIGRSDDTDARLDLRRRDEIGQLANEFDGMLEKLAKSRAAVVDSARLAGMSELSAGVIHNVGNVLNSVNVAAQMARKSLQTDDLNSLGVILRELQTHQGELDRYLADDPRGKHLIEFFDALVPKLESGFAKTGSEVLALAEGVEHIMALISSLENADSRVGLLEQVNLGQQMDAAIELCQRSLDLGEIEIERHYDPHLRILVDRHKLMEVLINLVRNALQALMHVDAITPRLTLHVERTNDDCLSIKVADNGVGIEHEDLTRIFALGHSTKPGGRGLGLHLSANTVGEMGGNLTAHSEGPGRGSTFTLRLPDTAHARAGP